MSQANETARLLSIISALARNLYSSVLVGNSPPEVRKLFVRMTNPVPGDLVIEATTALYGRASGSVHGKTAGGLGGGIGILDRSGRESMKLEEWQPEIDGPIPTELIWYIRRLDNPEETVRWENATFIAIPPFPEEK